MRRSEGGQLEKCLAFARMSGNSLAAYPTACPVWGAAVGNTGYAVRWLPTTLH